MPYIGTSPSNGVRRVHTYTATASQTTFTGASSEGVTLSYVDTNYIDVFQNGVLLGSADYTSTSGTSVVLAQGASADDLIVIVVYDVFSVADTVSKTNGGSFDGIISTSSAGTSNLRIGANAGDAIASGGNYNVVIGDEAGTALTTGDNNVAVGFEALKTEDTASRSTAVGYRALLTQNAGDVDANNTAVGYNAGTSITTGVQNVFLGNHAGDDLNDADYNIAIGYAALDADTKGSKSTAIGYNALGQQNFTSATDSDNVAVGDEAGASITTSKGNALLGATAGDAITTGLYNTCIGAIAGSDITEGEGNVMIGYSAGSYSNDFITGSQNNCIGAYTVAGGTSDVGANSLGYNLTAHGGYTTVGNGSNDIRALHGNTTWSTVSDERYKKNIEDAKAGLSFINALKPRTFKYKTLGELPETFSAYKADSTKVFKNENTNHGFIAQEVKQAIDADNNLKDGFRLWDERGDGSQEIAETALIPMLVKAIQELSAKNDALETENKTQATQIADLISRITALENAE